MKVFTAQDGKNIEIAGAMEPQSSTAVAAGGN